MKTIVNYAQKVKEQHALNKTLAPVETDLTDASRSYAIGEQFINDGDLFKAKTAIAQHDALVLDTNYEAADDITTQIKNKTVTTDPVPTEGSTNPVQSNGVFVEDRNIYKVMGKNGAKNLSKPINSTTYNGITVVCDSDGVLTVTGTASASGGRLNITGDTFTLKAGTYKVVQNSDDLTKYASIVCHRKSDNTSLGYVLIENGTINNTNAQFTLAADTECFLGMNTYQGTDYGTGAGTKEYAMVVLADDTDTTYQPYAKTNQQLTAENEALTNKLNNEIVTRSALGAKNILPFDLAEIKALNINGTWAGNVYTYRGVAFTVNSDGTISATGTATGGNASIKLFAASSNYEMLGKEVILTGCPSNGSASTYRIQAYRMASADGSTGTYFDDGAGTDAFTVLNDASGTVGSFAVAVYENATVTNLLFKPMVRLASDPDATYQPYAKTNRELTAENQTLTNQVKDMNNVLGAKNLLPNNVTSQTVSGVTYTKNADGTITINGTRTTTGGITISEFSLEAGKKYKYSIGNPFNLSNTAGSTIQGYDGTAWVTLGNIFGTEIEAEFESNSAYSKYRVNINSNNGVAFSNLTIKPMIRLASIEDDTYEPYAKTNQQLTQDTTALLDNLEVNGAVNIIHPNGTSKVEGGITYQLNDDGTVVANGTPTGVSGFGWVTFNGENLVGKTLKFSCETTNVYPRAYFAIACRETVSGPNLLREDAYLEDKKVKVAFTVPSNTKIIIVNFNTNTNTTDNISTTLKPMLTVASYNGDYVPYAKSNKELTEDFIPKVLTVTPNSSYVDNNNLHATKYGQLVILSGYFRVHTEAARGEVLYTLPSSVRNFSGNASGLALGNNGSAILLIIGDDNTLKVEASDGISTAWYSIMMVMLNKTENI